MILYMMVFAMGSVIMSYLGVDFMTAVGLVATSIGNIGPGIGSVGTVNNFAHIPLLYVMVSVVFNVIGQT